MGIIPKNQIENLYIKDIRATKAPTKEEERELFRRLRAGDQSARDALIRRNMRFVLSVALRYQGCPLPLPDLLSEGAMGVAHAVDTFDHSRDLRFYSYAVWWIRAYIGKAIDETGSVIRLPGSQHLRVRKALKATRCGGELDEDIREMIQLGSAGTSLDSPLSGTDGDATVQDTLIDHDAPDPVEEIDGQRRKGALLSMLSRLPDREAQVIRACYGLDTGAPKTFREVAEQMGVTHQRVQQLCGRAYGVLRRLARGNQDHIHEISGLRAKVTTQEAPDPTADQAKFFANVNKTDGGCWLWTGTPAASGAGRMLLGRKFITARKYAYELVHGPIPASAYTIATCGIRSCCAPEHTVIMTRAEYARHIAAARGGGPADWRGAGNGNARLTEHQVVEIRAAYAAGGASHRVMAQKYGVNRITIANIVNNRSWKNVAATGALGCASNT